jgi:hypothetical protein
VSSDNKPNDDFGKLRKQIPQLIWQLVRLQIALNERATPCALSAQPPGRFAQRNLRVTLFPAQG